MLVTNLWRRIALVLLCAVLFSRAALLAKDPPPTGKVVPATGDAAKPVAKGAAPNSQNSAVQRASATAVMANKQQIVAIVNQEEIGREELSKDCLSHYGKEVLESLVNKHLIAQELRRQGKEVTEDEVQDEIDKTARRVSLTKEQFLNLLERERNIRPARYGLDIVWPTLALRKVAAGRLSVSTKELDEGYESQFGEAVQCRILVVDDEQKAKSLHEQLVKNPDDFPRLARQHSIEVNSAQAGGMMQPIRRYLGDIALEKAAFALGVGDVSPVVPVMKQYAILKCEGRVPAIEPDRKSVEPLLKEAIRDRKLRKEAGSVFKELQSAVEIVNVYNDPQQSKEHPGVAAILKPRSNAPGSNSQITDRQITLRELAEECIARHGEPTLEGIINRHLLEQALKKRGLTVTQADLDLEVDRAALSMGHLKADGTADRNAWLAHITQEEGISTEMYVRDSVWPSVALKTVVGDKVQVNEDDLQRGFEANYGPRVRCRAIMLHNQRKAQEVWEKARDNPTIENFASLARKFSIEANSASLGGEVPPIQKHGGQPILEREAFKLQPGELSGIIQVGEQFVVLMCEGYTRPVQAKLDDVKDLILADIKEKKVRLEMSKKYQELQNTATIDNFLAGTIKTPNKNGDMPLFDPTASKTKDGTTARNR